MSDLIPLQPLTFPLHGVRLIEASAGTGKTYTITALYLRLLLGHGDQGPVRPLGPDQILVVTFTEAATEELRDRIRVRIAEARQAFMLALNWQEVKDLFLSQLIEAIEDKEAAVKLLEQAAQQMDEAAIFTIHGFCQRMLKRHAFESGALFETELTQDSQRLLHQAVMDFWRNEIYRMEAGIASAVLHLWKTPVDLGKDLNGFWNSPELRLQPDLSEQNLTELFTQFQSLLQRFKALWLSQGGDLEALIRDSGVSKQSYRKNLLPNWLAKIGEFCETDSSVLDKKLVGVLERFQQSRLHEKSPKGNPPEHELFRLTEELLEARVPVREIMLARAFRDVRQRFNQHKAQHNLLTFDDLLINLDRSLSQDQSGLLASAIRTQFPLALIDEFQDTDPMQYRIFSQIYAAVPDEEAQAPGLVMIGDPKQAIYAFRGADIFTYIRARRQVDAPYTLDTNWRSTSRMVESVNRIFETAQAPFIYEQDIKFQSVKAGGKSDKKPLQMGGKALPAMTFWYQDDDAPINRNTYFTRFARSTAVEIERLLAGDTSMGDQPLAAGDIAVLVRDRYEADAIRTALTEFQRPCVYLSNRESVFATQEALDMLLLLQAVQEPNNERFVRAALATSVLQLDVEALDRLNHDERAWEAAVAEFTEYQQVWLRLGVLPMLHRLLQRRKLSELMLSRADGERRLTDLLHLGELLQTASTEVEGTAGLLRWYAEKLNSPNGSSEDQQLRLESDRNLVTLVTIHKSKGLEYPVVFLPFPCAMKESKQALYHDDSGETVVDLQASDEAMAKADEERLAEDLRLLYVALTRSVYACYMGVADVKVGQKKDQLRRTALGYLLLQEERELDEAMAGIPALSAAITVLEPPQSAPQIDLFAAEPEAKPELQVRTFKGRIKRDWRVTSYSALSSHGSGYQLPELPGLDLEVAGEEAEVAEPEQTIFSFPKGARAGTFLHAVFEDLDFPTAGGPELDEYLQERLTLEGYETDWTPVLNSLVADVLDSDLDGQGLRMRDLTAQDKLVEMEFMLPVSGLDCGALNQLVRAEDNLSAQAGLLSFDQVNGMLKGFIDLVFRHEGRYYVLDYKSNYLGGTHDAYTQEAMAGAMIDHRYDLQYQLYTLALHRLLQSRIPDYNYEEHMGGVFYLFLRGMGQGDHGVFHCRPDAGFIEQLDQQFRAGETA
ncbi:exodeoxyribonuclease V subunit beta [Pontibacterium sp. N1Y112]|uniref:RecBCD enzyme subunit RecB n=1 Tax=Pontibacterium sinense TaxID=2781979 RepID=A0A8J7FCE2_9GAMM|nr:exodeoxyribonuclease V subunit beta [Pontibacterium sinense]MBE9397492.1 exodeoxyribonuclease V subunit beta [Pontibacterium sinense]